MHAHDPRRYVSDMLAWVHTSLASEREFLVSLFGEEEGEGGPAESDPAAAPATPPAAAAADSSKHGGGGDGAPSLAQLLDSVFESICRPLKVGGAVTLRVAGADQMEQAAGSRWRCLRLSRVWAVNPSVLTSTGARVVLAA